MNLCRRPIMWLFVAIMFFSMGITPMTVAASTPPLLPEMTVTLPEEIYQNSDFDVMIEWDSNDVALFAPPEEIYIEIYTLPDGGLVMETSLPRDDDAVSAGESVVYYKGEVAGSGLPAGEMMVIATDPVSGAVCRMKAEVTGSNSGFPSPQSSDFLYNIAAAVLIVLLILIIGYLIRVKY